METLEEIIYSIFAIIFLALIAGLPLMILWNMLMPHIFNLPYISFWQALGLNMLSTLLFKSTSIKIKK
jgi:hypothetical protein